MIKVRYRAEQATSASQSASQFADSDVLGGLGALPVEAALKLSGVNLATG